MKKTLQHKLVAILILTCLTGFIGAQMEPFAYERKVQKPFDTWHKIELPNAVTAKLNSRMSDLRLYGITSEGDTVEAPYIVDVKASTVDRKVYPHSIINKSSRSGIFFYTIQMSKAAAINELKLQFAEQNYDRTITVEGSRNQGQWFQLVKDYRITAIKTADVDFEYADIALPTADYQYYRLAITASAQPNLTKVETVDYQETTNNYQRQTVSAQTIRYDKAKKQTIIDIELAEKSPVSKVSVPINVDYDYYRPATLQYVSDSIETTGTTRYIYKSLASVALASNRSNAIMCSNTFAKKLRLIIYDYDNAALSYGSLQIDGYPTELITRITTPADYQLIYGLASASTPQYDISRFGDRIPADIKPLKLGPEVRRELPSDSPPLLKNPLWLWLVMGVAISLLGIFAIRMISEKKGV